MLWKLAQVFDFYFERLGYEPIDGESKTGRVHFGARQMLANEEFVDRRDPLIEILVWHFEIFRTIIVQDHRALARDGWLLRGCGHCKCTQRRDEELTAV